MNVFWLIWTIASGFSAGYFLATPQNLTVPRGFSVVCSVVSSLAGGVLTIYYSQQGLQKKTTANN